MKDFRRFVSEDYRILSSPDYSQDAKKDALLRLKNQKNNGNRTGTGTDKQRPANAYQEPNVGINVAIPEGGSYIDDMNKRVDAYNGYETSPGSYQSFQSKDVYALPKTVKRTHNTTNHGFASEAPSKTLMRDRGIAESVHSMSHQLHQSSQRMRQHIGRIYETFERSSDVSQEELYLIGLNLGILSENYDTTAGQWVVTMPYANPQSAEQVLYNQRGISTVDYKTLTKQQKGNYHVTNNANDIPGYRKELPPAKEGALGSNVEYSSSDTKALQSLKNPKRGDDFIRRSRLEQDKLEESWMRMDNTLKTKELQPWQHNKLRTEMNAVVDKIKSNKAIRKDYIKNKSSNEGAKKAVNSYAEQLEGFHHPDAETREQSTYNSHLNLLESAKRVLSDKNRLW